MVCLRTMQVFQLKLQSRKFFSMLLSARSTWLRNQQWRQQFAVANTPTLVSLSPSTLRTVCTKSFKTPGIEGTVQDQLKEELQVRINNEEPLREDTFSEDGRLLYSMRHDDLDPDKIDWKEFERAFGVDHLHKVPDLENWNFRSADTVTCCDDDVDIVSDQPSHFSLENDVKKAYQQFSVMKGQSGEFTLSPMQHEDLVESEARKKIEAEDWGKFDDFVEKSLRDPSYRLRDDLDPIVVSEVVGEGPSLSEKRAKPKREVEDDGSTHKQQRRRKTVSQTSHASEDHPSYPKRRMIDDPLKRHPDLAESFANTPMPVNTRRVGYEHRILSLQMQMERIANEVLCTPEGEFERAGAVIHHVMLSTDGFTLKIFFELDETNKRITYLMKSGLNIPNQTQGRFVERSRTIGKGWRKRIENSVRSALASQLHAKRVPKVELVAIRDEGPSSGGIGKIGTSCDITELLDQVSAERKRSSHK